MSELYKNKLPGKIIENKYSKKMRDIFQRIFQTNRNNESREEAEKRFEKYNKDTATGRKHHPEQK